MSEARPILKHGSLWFDDGNVVISALENELSFKLHRSVLGLHSEVFRDMFLLPQPIDDNQVEGCPVVQLSDTAKDLDYFFTALYYSRKGTFFNRKTPVEFAAVSALLRLGSKYQVDYFRDEAIHRLERCYPKSLQAFDDMRQSGAKDKEKPISDLTPEHAIVVVNIARSCNYNSPLPPALYLCAQLPLATILRGVPTAVEPNAVLGHLSSDDIETCLKSREEFLRARIEAITFLYNYHSDSPCRMSSGSCLLRKVKEHKIPTFNLGPHIRKLSIDFDVLAPLSSQIGEHELCEECFEDICEKYDVEREEIWRTLGDVFGVGSWIAA